MKPKILWLYLFLVFIEGCQKTFLPANEKGGLKYPSRTRSGQSYTADKRDFSCTRWWEKFKNPELNQLIEKALASNNEIQSANATIDQAQAQLQAALYDWFPTLDASVRGFGGGTWDANLTPKGNLARSGMINNISNLKFHGYNAGLTPTYSLNILQNINNVKAAGSSLAIKRALAQATQLRIITQMSHSYFLLLSQREQLNREKILIEDLKKLSQLEQVRYKKGADDIERTTTLDQEIAQEKAKIPQIENAIAQTENAIHLLLNQNPGSMTTIYTLSSLKTNNLIPNNLPSSVLKNRPDVMVALNNIKTANAELGIAYSAFFPSIALTGTAGSISLDLKKLLGLTGGFWTNQALAAIKLLNGNAYQTIKAAKARYIATYYDYLQTLRAAFADVDNHLTNEQKKRAEYLQTQNGYVAAKKLYNIAFSQYKAGAKDYRDAANAKINVDRYQLTLIQEKTQLLTSIVQTYNALGGGFNVKQTVVTSK
ncbi:efflux transporter outer membrane subunit [Legionella fairfieldensis]|uniref:efflux transporter outer membrane subunit n=1 Tax=Legionella fairfieldensis TaxID=45064 RepID=UPI000B1501AA|nr:efflux transporter outer membrane subunit [Legionella fairfieldensis]